MAIGQIVTHKNDLIMNQCVYLESQGLSVTTHFLFSSDLRTTRRMTKKVLDLPNIPFYNDTLIDEPGTDLEDRVIIPKWRVIINQLYAYLNAEPERFIYNVFLNVPG